MNVTIRNMPNEVVEKLRMMSQIEKRSLNNEILIVIEHGINEELKHTFDMKKNISKETQINIWEKLAGAWEDDRTSQEIIKDICDNSTFTKEGR